MLVVEVISVLSESGVVTALEVGVVGFGDVTRVSKLS